MEAHSATLVSLLQHSTIAYCQLYLLHDTYAFVNRPITFQSPAMLPFRSFNRAVSLFHPIRGTALLQKTPSMPTRSILQSHHSLSSMRAFSWHSLSRTLGHLCKRPVLDVLRSRNTEQSRGMKVRSSVKKLCDGCKVRRDLSAAIFFAKAFAPALIDITKTVLLNYLSF